MNYKPSTIAVELATKRNTNVAIIVPEINYTYISHVISGLIYFNAGMIDATFPTSNMFVYSFIYQISYIGPDMIIALVVTILLATTKTLSRLEKIVKK